MMAIPKKLKLIRLVTAVLGSFASVWFVVNYTKFSHLRFNFEHKDGGLMRINEYLVPHASWFYALPLVSLSIGLWLVVRRSRSIVALELLISATWLLSLGLMGFCVLIWQIQNVPTFSHMQWHF